jgi:hypothetical protein
MIGAQASNDQLEKILSYLDIGKQEGAKVLIGGERAHLAGDLEGGYYVQPTIFQGHNRMRVFQEEIFGPVVSVATFKDDEEALAIANDTLYGLGTGVWSRNGNRAFCNGPSFVNPFRARCLHFRLPCQFSCSAGLPFSWPGLWFMRALCDAAVRDGRRPPT